MLRVLTKEEELAMRAEGFARLRAGMLFDLGRRRPFIAVRKRGRTVEVIEIDSANIDRILRGKPCAHTRLRFADMSCLNLHHAAEPNRCPEMQLKPPPRPSRNRRPTRRRGRG